MNTFILQEHINLIKNYSKYIYNGTKNLYLKYMFLWTSYLSKNPECITVSTIIYSTTKYAYCDIENCCNNNLL